MWMLKAVSIFLVVWAVWCVFWIVIFAGLEIATGHAPFLITLGAIVALLVTGKILERRKRKRNE